MYELYQHYSGTMYLRLLTALHSETLESHEVYRTLYDNEKSPSWIRPQEMFHEQVATGASRFTLTGRVGRALPEDEAELASFGFDAWGNGQSVHEYVHASLESRDHMRGTRWFLEGSDGSKQAVLNLLRFARGTVGFASVATSPKFRGKGLASLLVRAVMELERIEQPHVRFLLFSEARPVIFERLGFKILPDSDQHFRPSLAMATGELPITERERGFLRDYF
jgi:GNAT superfamily N-acetyltransferase